MFLANATSRRSHLNSAYWVYCHAYLSSIDFFQNKLCQKNSFRNTIRVSSSLNPDQVRRFVGPDLGPNCLQRLSADDTSIQRVYCLSALYTTVICSLICLCTLVVYIANNRNPNQIAPKGAG